MKLLAGAVLLLLGGCGGGGGHVETPVGTPTATAPSAAAFPEDARSWGRFHSKRFALSVPLPDGKTWRIDDHSRRELHATHAPTRSELTMFSWYEPEVMNRQRCEERARALGLAPSEEELQQRPLRTVADEVVVGPEAYDTRLWIAVRPGINEGAPIAGHVFAFGAYVRKCLFFHFASEVPTGRDEAVLSDRLAAAHVRVFGGIALDDFDAVPRERPRQ